MGAGDDILAVLKRLEGKVDRLLLAEMLREIPAVADDALLEEKGGDPQSKIAMRKWVGKDYKGKRFSECSPEYLDKLADTLMWMAHNPREGVADALKFARFNALDAGRARGWAKRLRAGWKPPVDEYAQPEVSTEDHFADDGPGYDD